MAENMSRNALTAAAPCKHKPRNSEAMATLCTACNEAIYALWGGRWYTDEEAGRVDNCHETQEWDGV